MISKIARLPKTIRTELDHRLEDGHLAIHLVEWLNSLPEVREMTKKQFRGRCITPQNVSDWKQAGHLDWLRRQEAREAAFMLMEHAEDLAEAEASSAADRRHFGESFTKVFTAEFAQLAMRLLEQEKDLQKKWQLMCQINQQLSRLRRDDYRKGQLNLQQEQWQRQVEQEDRGAHAPRVLRLTPRQPDPGAPPHVFPYQSSNPLSVASAKEERIQ